MERFLQYLNDKKEQGLFSEYSDDHFLIRAMNNDLDYFKKCEFLMNNLTNPNIFSLDYISSFLINFNMRLKHLEAIFSEKSINVFIKDQLSAGKKNNYSQEQFFRAFSEVSILNYVHLFSKAYKSNVKSEYEPRNGINGANPEARFILDNDIIIDVEVKTPGFSDKVVDISDSIGVIRPNTYLSNSQFAEIRKYCQDKNIKFLPPDITKLSYYLEDASKKFLEPTSKRHYNILFINWTYTEIPQTSYNEAISLLINNMSGILKNKIVQKDRAVGMTREKLSKISAIVFYFENMESTITSDFRMLYMNNKFRLIINDDINQDCDKLLEILILRNHKEFIIKLHEDAVVDMLDYSFKPYISKDQINNIGKDIYEIIFSEINLYRGLVDESVDNNTLHKIMNMQKLLVSRSFDILN